MSELRKIAVVIPCYNHGAYLPEAVQSVRALNRGDVDAIVVDDGSTEEKTRQAIDELGKQGVQIIRQENRGLAAARNAGIAATRAEYIFPLDADDRLRAGWIDQAVEVLRNSPRVGVVYGDAQCFGVRTYRWKTGGFDPRRLMSRNYIHASALYRRAVWEESGGYDSHLPGQVYEDWDLWLGALEHGWEFHYLEEVFFDYRQHEKSMITDAVDFEEKVREYAARKHAILYWKEFHACWEEGVALQEERRSIKKSSRNLAALVKARLKRKLGLSESRNGASEGRGQR